MPTIYSYKQFLEKYMYSNSYSPYVAGKVIAGRNGLYCEEEAHLRNLCHWSIIENEIGRRGTIQEQLKNEVSAIDKFPPALRKSNKDACNGLIGMAWLLEAIGICFSKQEIDSCFSIAKLEEYLSGLDFDYSKGVWRAVLDADGTKKPIDRTFNHQLWFAVSLNRISRILSFSVGSEQSNRFIEKVKQSLYIQRDGLIYHTVKIYPHFHKTFVKRLINKTYRSDMRKKEYGYHYFNLMQLGKFESNLGVKTDKFGESGFLGEIKNNPYASTYNPVGLEAAVYYSSFDPGKAVNALNYHFSNYFDGSVFAFSGGEDEPTLNARLYEICHLESSVKKMLQFDAGENAWII